MLNLGTAEQSSPDYRIKTIIIFCYFIQLNLKVKDKNISWLMRKKDFATIELSFLLLPSLDQTCSWLAGVWLLHSIVRKIIYKKNNFSVLIQDKALRNL